MTGQLKIGLVLVNWNSTAMTVACIQSVLDGLLVPWRILVFDNASRDEPAKSIRRRFPHVDVVAGDTNRGFTGANNEGIRKLIEAGADLVWVLNNDTIVHEGCLKALTEAIQREQSDVVTGKILYEHPPDRLWYGGGSLNLLRMTARHHGLGQVDAGQCDTPSDVGFVSGCCMLVTRDCFREVGLFDERYFAYYEDVEWCLRAREKGQRLRYAPAAVLVHRVGASMQANETNALRGRFTARFHYLSARNHLYTIQLRAVGAAHRGLALVVCLAYNAYILSGLLAFARWDKLGARLAGVRDGLVSCLHRPNPEP